MEDSLKAPIPYTKYELMAKLQVKSSKHFGNIDWNEDKYRFSQTRKNITILVGIINEKLINIVCGKYIEMKNELYIIMQIKRKIFILW